MTIIQGLTNRTTISVRVRDSLILRTLWSIRLKRSVFVSKLKPHAQSIFASHFFAYVFQFSPLFPNETNIARISTHQRAECFPTFRYTHDTQCTTRSHLSLLLVVVARCRMFYSIACPYVRRHINVCFFQHLNGCLSRVNSITYVCCLFESKGSAIYTQYLCIRTQAVTQNV